MRMWRLLLPLLVCIPLAGCARPAAVLSPEQLESAGRGLERLDRVSDSALRVQIESWEDELAKKQDRRARDEAGRLHFLIGYAYERMGRYSRAVEAYGRAGASGYSYMAMFRKADIERLELQNGKAASGSYSRGAPPSPVIQGWIRVSRSDPERSVLASDAGGRLVLLPLQPECRKRLDAIHRDTALYKFIDAVVRLMGGNPRYSHALALIFLALAVKIVTTPLTNMSMRSMRRMQALQPLITELQEKYKNDRQAIAKEQWALMRKHKVNPMGGCLPMLIQMPILLVMWRGIQGYIWRLSPARFLWIKSLAQPDMPLLLMYAFSMYLSQKLTTMPTADPKQQQMQKTMMWMMPVLFTTMLSTMQSAFILYWLAYNVFFTAHQYFLVRQPAPAIQPEQAPQSPGPPPRLRSRKKKR
jgi:YidC/Oxa1 family membrane protein insertase